VSRIVYGRGIQQGPAQSKGRASTLVAIAGAFLLAGFSKALSVSDCRPYRSVCWGLLMTPAQAAAVLVVPSLVTNIWQAAVGGGLLGLARRLWPLLAGICIGTAASVVFPPRDNNGRATVWLGLALAIYAALGLVKVEFSVSNHAETWLGLLMGAATGAITVATGIFVMPGTPYIQSMEFDRDRLVQTLGLSFTVSTIALAAAHAYTRHVQTSLASPSIVALVATLIGMGLGQLTRGKIKAETFRLCFFVGLMFLGLHLALRGLL